MTLLLTCYLKKVNVDDAPGAEDTIIGDELFRRSKTKDEEKKYTDDILQQTNHNDMHVTQTTVEPIKP